MKHDALGEVKPEVNTFVKYFYSGPTTRFFRAFWNGQDFIIRDDSFAEGITVTMWGGDTWEAVK